MDDMDGVLARIDAAMTRIRAAVDDNASTEHEGEAIPLYRKARRLGRANDVLRHELDTLREKRAQDIKEIDELVTQLKPLIGEA